ncbi:MAG: hypothetical protein AAFP70_21730, partial [Calditrichota bacterium]
MMLFRDGELLDSIDSDIESYLDTGLTPGTVYQYSLQARVDSVGLLGDVVSTQWTAGGARKPETVSAFAVNGTQNNVDLVWINPSNNIDGTPLNDFAGVHIYRDDVLEATLTRDPSTAGASDGASVSVSPTGYYAWNIVAFDSDTPRNESRLSDTQYTPLGVPLSESFEIPGIPARGIWRSYNVEVNDRADSPPNGSYALNLNGTPVGSDTLEMRPIDLSNSGSGLSISYQWQPQGTGNAPEPGDSLRLYFKDNLGGWYLVRGYDGTTLMPFTEEFIELDSIDAGNGVVYHDNFQLRFISMGGSGNFPNDDWFIGAFGINTAPLGVGDSEDLLPTKYEIGANYPNPFNPTTTIDFQLPQRSDVELVVFN